MVTIIGWLLMVTCVLAAAACLVGWGWAMGVSAVAPRRQPMLRRQAVTATVIPNRAAAPARQLRVSFWEPPQIKGELER